MADGEATTEFNVFPEWLLAGIWQSGAIKFSQRQKVGCDHKGPSSQCVNLFRDKGKLF